MAHLNGNSNGNSNGTGLRLKTGLAEMLKGGVIMDVMNVEQARIAEEAGAVSVMALERVPAMIRAEGGVARMANPKLIKEIMATVSIPVMAKARIGHFAEAQVLESLGVDFIDESEVLTPADETYHIDKHAFTTPFVCGARNLGEALRRIAEGAAMIRTKGEPGTGDVVHAVQHMRQITREIRILSALREEELFNEAKLHGAPYELVKMVAAAGKLPVPNFSAGGIATPADAALMMQLGAETVFVGSGIFMKDGATPLDLTPGSKQRDEAISRAKAIVLAATHFNDPKIVSEASEMLIGSMKGLAAAGLEESQRMQTRGW
ncbi:pyridoxal 5'-phosphate synthase lyase subunit PdxS [Terriglobus tenax]|uniref:pyridoxal 5'-phosphate synthase lyase subunit PdxS n=1 Tax=Terriglobus tenax TaxID=1111115 RepID=UPI0021DFF9B4|nr:pyridoxal 5'-phosphate synthase lyase subunit PdxS [Terriglobus tenax]